MLKAVIFDMDGVIIDSEPLHMEATKETLKEFDVFPDTPYLEQFIGSTTERMYETIIQDYNIPVTLEDLLAIDSIKCRAVYDREGMPQVPGVVDLIKKLYKSGIKLGIASSSPLKRIEQVAHSFGVSKYFQKFVSGTTVENPKPAPDIFLKALKELGASHKETIVIEDSSNGCLAAREAGISCVGFLNPNSGKQDLSAASVITESFENLDTDFFEHVLLRANGLPITICNTRRLIIRELTVEDIKDLYQIYQNKDVTQYIDDMSDYLDIEVEKHKAYIKNVYSFYGYGLWGVYSKTTKKLIGRCGIENKVIDGKQEIELSYLLDKQHWGYGYALECCKSVIQYAKDTLEIKRLAAVIDKLNARSINLAINLGMVLEKEIVNNNRSYALYVLDLSKSDYLKARDEAAKKYIQDPDTSVYGKRFKDNTKI